MPVLNNLTKFLLGFIVLYTVIFSLHLTGPVKTVHIDLYNASQQLVFNLFHPTVRTDFRRYTKTQGVNTQESGFDFSIYIFTRERWRMARLNPGTQPNFILNQRAQTHITFSLFLSLLLLSPISWKRKGLSLFLGSFIILTFYALKYSFLFQESGNLTMGNLSVWKWLTDIFGSAFRTQEFLLLCVVGAWAMVSLRKSDYQWFLK